MHLDTAVTVHINMASVEMEMVPRLARAYCKAVSAAPAAQVLPDTGRAGKKVTPQLASDHFMNDLFGFTLLRLA